MQHPSLDHLCRLYPHLWSFGSLSLFRLYVLGMIELAGTLCTELHNSGPNYNTFEPTWQTQLYTLLDATEFFWGSGSIYVFLDIPS